MICHRCILRLRSTSTRLYTTARSPPTATSTSAAQPFSTPFTPSRSRYPDTTSSSIPGSKSTAVQAPPAPEKKSSLKAGTPMRGLQFLKDREAPVAREDDEYPDWLWGLLKSKGEGGAEREGKGAGGDAFSKSAKQRRLASRAARSSASSSSSSLSSSLNPTVPLHEQSIDLPSAPGNRFGREIDFRKGEEAREGREAVGRAMRGARRKGIKEGNFLRGMR